MAMAALIVTIGPGFVFSRVLSNNYFRFDSRGRRRVVLDLFVSAAATVACRSFNRESPPKLGGWVCCRVPKANVCFFFASYRGGRPINNSRSALPVYFWVQKDPERETQSADCCSVVWIQNTVSFARRDTFVVVGGGNGWIACLLLYRFSRMIDRER